MSSGADIDFSQREKDAVADELFVQRWSPRVFETSNIEQTTLQRIIDAARWAPSCFNEQPWKIITSTPDTYDAFVSLLVEANQAWARSASLIGFMVGSTQFARNGKTNDYTDFDCGAAWMSIALQARMEGLYTHGMAGIDHQRVAEYLQLDATQEKVIMGFALGQLGDKSSLADSVQEKEVPNARKSLEDIWVQKS